MFLQECSPYLDMKATNIQVDTVVFIDSEVLEEKLMETHY